MSRITSSQRGFTILELMIATVVFSVLLLGAATMLVQIGRMYYKGVVSSRTQETARTITDDIGRALQFTGGGVAASDSPLPVDTPQGRVEVQAFCIGDVRYSYILDGQVSADVSSYEPGTRRENYVPRALWRDQGEAPPNCAPLNILDTTATNDSNGREMLGEGMRLYRFGPPSTQESGLASFTVGIVYGQDDELIEFTGAGDSLVARCRGLGLGAQWCATSELQSTVFRRAK